MTNKKLICIYQVMMPYRVGVFERLAKMEGIDFELLFGESDKHSKKKNYEGPVTFSANKQWSFYLQMKNNNGESSLQIMPWLFFVLLWKRPDVILCEGASSLFNASVAFIYAKLFRKKYIWWSLGELKNRKHTGMRKRVDSWIHCIEKNSDAIFTYSTYGAHHFIVNRHIPKEKVFISVNVIDTDKKLADIKGIRVEKTKDFHIVFVGAIIKVKRLEILVDAFRNLSSKYPHIYLDIIGDGNYLPTIEEYINNGSNDRINLLGRKSGKDLSLCLLQSDVLVLPGLGGLALCDGMIHSLPIICGPADGTEMDLIDESCGYVTDDVTQDYLEEKLTILINDRDKAQKMGGASYQRITEMFSIHNYMKHLSDCIYYVLKNH